MKLHSPEFERRLRKHIRPAWKKAKKRRGSAGRSALRQYLLPPRPFLAVFTGMFAVRLSESGLSTEASVALFGLLLTCIMVLCQRTAGNTVRQLPELPLFIWLPSSADLAFARAWRRFIQLTCHFFAVIGIVLAVLAFRNHSLSADFFKLILVSILGAFAAAAVALLPVRISKRGALLLLLSLGGITFFRIPLLMPWLSNLLQEHGSKLSWFHPGGWILTLWQATSAKEFPDWRMLSAAPLLLLTGCIPLIRSYWQKEFIAEWERFHPDDLADLESGENTSDAPSETPAITLEKIQAEWRTPILPLAHGLIETWILNRLSGRERMLMDTLGNPLPQHAKKCGLACFSYAALFAAAWSLREFNFLASYLAIPLFLIGLAIFLTTFPLNSSLWPEYATLQLFPISYKEIAWLEWKIASPGVLLMTLPNVAAGAGISFLTNNHWSMGALMGLKLSVLSAALFPAFITFRFSQGTNDTAGWGWAPIFIILEFALSIGMFGASIAAFFVPSRIAWALLGAAAAWWFIMLLLHSRAWSRCKFDIISSIGLRDQS